MTLNGKVHGDLSSVIIILSAIRRSSLPIPHSLTYSSWDQGYFYIPSYVSYLWWKEEAQANWVAEEEAKRVLEADLIEKLVETKCHRGIANKTCHPETWLQSWAWVCSSEKSNLFSWFLVADNQAVIKDISLLIRKVTGLVKMQETPSGKGKIKKNFVQSINTKKELRTSVWWWRWSWEKLLTQSTYYVPATVLSI